MSAIGSIRIAKHSKARRTDFDERSPASGNFIELTAEIVSAYVSNNTVPAGDIPA